MNLAIAACVLLSSCAAVSSTQTPDAPAERRANHVTVYLGQRSLDEDDWEPLEDQLMFGLEYGSERPSAAVGWELGFMASTDDGAIVGSDAELGTTEFYPR